MAKRGNYGKWSQDDLQRAVDAYRNGDFGLNECGRIYGVPKGTIKRHADGKNSVANEIKLLGRQPTFDHEMQEVLRNHLLMFEQMFYGFTILEFRKLAFEVAEKYGLPHSFNKEKKCAGKKWYYNFMRNNPQLSLRRPEATSLARVKGFNKDNVMHFFDILEKTVKDNNINANTIFNVDESGYSTVQKHMQKVIAKKGKKQVGGVTSGERGINTTMVCAVSASGIYVPPMIIFKRKIWLEDLRFGAPLGSIVKISDSGYINSDLFFEWLRHFHSFVSSTKTNKVLLLLDGHTTHCKNLEALEYARENGIILLQLPGHTSHRLQPLDVAFFGPLQKYFVQAQDAFLREYKADKVTQLQVSKLLNEAYGKAATVGNAASSFRASGCWPVNRNVFRDCDFAGASALQPENQILPPSEVSEPQTPEPGTSKTHNYIQNISKNTSSTSSELDDTDEDSDYEPASKKVSFRETLLKVSPLPKRNLFQAVSRGRGQGRGRGCGAQKAVVITSSPYKLALEEKKTMAKEKEERKRERIEKRSEKLNKNTGVVKKVGRGNIKKETSWYCYICDEASHEDMIQCIKCHTWVHTICAGVKKGIKQYFCSSCHE